MEIIESPFTNNIALFIDFENLIRSAMDIGLPVNLEIVIKKLLENGRVLIRRGFGDLGIACRGNWGAHAQIRRMIVENLIQFEDIPFINQHKNSADIRLVVEALSIAFTYPEIKTFAIVSSDRDYVPLIVKLRELGRRIIGIGCSPDTVNDVYVKSCDQFIYYSALFPNVQGQSQTIAPPQENSSLKEDYIKLLCDVVYSIVQKGAKPVGTAIAQLLQQRRPDFDLTLVGLRKFGDLVEEAERRDLCKKQSSGSDISIMLTPKGIKAIEQQDSSQYLNFSDEGSSVEHYRQFFIERLKCEMPSVQLRTFVYKKGAKILDQSKANAQGIGLKELSIKIGEEIQCEGEIFNPVSIFKVLYALFRARVFEAEWSDQAYNPLIKAALFSQDQWDDLFIKNCLTVLKREKTEWPFEAPALSRLFGIDTVKMASLLRDFE